MNFINKIMDRTLLNKLTFFIGGILIFATGMLYVLLTDLYLPVRAAWLLIGSVLSIGSAVCMLLSSNLQEERTKLIVVKSIAVALAACFIAFLFIYMNAALTSTVSERSDEYKNNVFALAAIFKDADKAKTVAMTVVSIVLSFIALIAQSANLYLTIADKTDD